MAQITIAQESVLYDGSESTLYLKIIAADSFHTSDGDLVTGGETYPVVSVPVSGGYAAVPETVIDSTTDSTDNPSARYAVAGLYKSATSTTPVVVLLDGFPVPPATPTTWANLRIRRDARVERPNYAAYTSDQTDAAIAASVAGVALADSSTSVKGKGKVDTAPAVSNNPIFVGANSARIAKNLTLDYSNSLATAVTSIGATETVLEVTRPVTVGANTTIPANIALDVKGTGLITVSAGFTLTIGNLVDPGNRQIFSLADATATVRFSNGAVRQMNAAWWAGNAADADVTVAINQMISSAAYAGGNCRIYIPQLAAYTDGGHDLGNSVVIFGNGNYNSGANGYGTTLRLNSGTAETYMFKVGGSTYSSRFENIVLDANGVANIDLVLFEGANPNTSADFSFHNVTFDSGARGFYHHSTSGSWQLAQVGFYNCIFQGCTEAFEANSVNGQYTLVNTNFAVPANGKAFDIQSCGLLTVIGAEFAGGGSTSKVMVISGSHGGINFIGCQDENFGTFVQNDASDISGITNITHGSLVQSKIQLNQSCIVNIKDSNLMSYALQGAAGGGYVSVSDCYIREVSVNDGVTVVSPAVLSSMSGNTLVVTENLSTLGRHVTRLPQRFISPYLALGAPSTPVLSVAHITNGTDEDKILLRLGRMTTSEIYDYYYDIYRDHGTGFLHFAGNQADPNKGFSFNAAVSVPDEAYNGTTWNGSLQVPTKNAIRDMVGVNVQAYSANLDEYAAVNPTAAGLALLDDADAAAQLVTLGVNATASEINQFNDVSAYQETLTAAGAISVTKIYTKLAVVGGGAVTLAVPDASMLGQVKTIEMSVDDGNVTLALTNVEGQSSGTTCTFDAVGDKLILVAGIDKWVVIKEVAVTMS